MNKMQIFAKALLEQIEVARVRQLSGLQESASIKHVDTAKAISLFQKYTGLDRTGVTDPKTMHMIKMVAEVGNPVRPRPAAAPETKTGTGASGFPMTPSPPITPPAAKPAVATQPAAKAAKPKPVFDQSVQDLQRQLIARGAKIKDDGFMGPKTQAAFKQFGPGAAPASGANPIQAAGGAPTSSPYASVPAVDTTTAGGAAMANKPAASPTTAGGAAMANKPAAGPAPGTVGTGSGGQLVDGSGKPVQQGAVSPEQKAAWMTDWEESVNRSNQRMVEDPELTAMLRIAGLR